jgi:2-methylcitrate dehydratase
MPTIAERIASYASSLRYEDLPDAVKHQAKRMIVDALGCAIGGYASPTADIARSFAREVTSKRPATVLCSGEQTSLELAAFANGVMIRYLDFNDGYTGKEAGHPSDSIAALLSSAEVANASGRDLITATVLSYEIFCRFCDVMNVKPLGWDHVTLGGIASVAGASRLLGLTAQQIEHAVNLQVAANIALYQTRIGDVSLWKGCAYANTSRNAVFAAQLAQRGMLGPSPIFEGRGGYFKAVSQRAFDLEAFGGPGQPFKIMECFVKRYPLGQYSQSVVQAAIEARGLIGSVDDIAEVHVRAQDTAIELMARDPEKWRPANRETADHSMPYTTGVALMYGAIRHEHFEPACYRDPRLLELVSRIKCSVSEEANQREPEAMLCDVEVVLRSGERKSVRVAHHRGHWRNPMPDAELAEKFHGLAAGVLPPAQTDRLLTALWQLDQAADIGALIRLTRVSSGGAA